jgi:hypothetical protein
MPPQASFQFPVPSTLWPLRKRMVAPTRNGAGSRWPAAGCPSCHRHLVFCIDRYRFGLSLINDLSAVIAASDPSERCPKLFGIDRGRQRCEVVGFCNSAGATQQRRDEACIEIRQARPKPAREILRQRVIGMLLVFGGTAYLVHVTNRVPRRPLGREARHDLTLLLRDIEPVERVEQNKAVALGNKERFPVLP